MNLKRIQDCERSRIERWSQFQLAHPWKNRAVIFCVAIIIGLIALKFTDTDYQWVKFGLRRALLVGLLSVSLSKEKIEDEMIVSLRAKSFTLAFVLVVLYALVQPAVNVIVFNVLGKEHLNDTFTYFQVLSFMLLIQILFFEVLKRSR